MKSNYKRIGDFIRLVDERNTGLKITKLLGLSISKQFIPSVANIIGTDMEKYKIIHKNQFACSIMQVRRDKKMPVALLQEMDEAIISQAYPIFEIIDEEQLLPEYLMMWFSREEFDREACFYAIGGVRGSLEWDDFCDMELPVPKPDKQKEIVKEYNILVNRIKLNNQFIQKLEETVQAIYKEWFVEFEFPDENGKPYKSNGGEMVESKLREIPKGWEVETLETVMKIKHGFAFKGEYIVTDENENILLTPGNFRIFGGFKGEGFKYYTGKIPKEYIFNTGDLMVTMTDLSVATDTLGYPAIIPELKGKKLLHNQRLGKIEIDYEYNIKYFIYWLMRCTNYRQTIVGSATGTTVKHTSPDRILTYTFPLCNDNIILNKFEEIASKIQIRVNQINTENHSLLFFKDLLLSKLATIGN